MPKLKCALCQYKILTGNQDFIQHVRTAHCLRASGTSSFECHYSPNSALCAVLRDTAQFEAHVLNVHIATNVRSSADEEVVGEGWSVYDCTQNLPALLNDPGRGRREADFFTKTWGDTFLEPNHIEPCRFLPIVKRVAFEDYLERTKARCKKRASSNSPKKGQAPRKPIDLTLEQVPQIFFRPNFDLSDPETFNAVLVPEELQNGFTSPTGNVSPTRSITIPITRSETNGRGPFARSPSPPVSPASKLFPAVTGVTARSRKLLQEKLGHFTDLVEVRLIQHISQHSDAFFDAMTSQDELAEKMDSTLNSITNMRERVAEIERKLVKEPLRVLQLHQQRQNMLIVLEKLELMLNVHQAQPTIQVLLANCEFVGALDLIDTTQEILQQELKDVVCFRHLGHQLKEIEGLILRILETDFKKYTAADLNRELNSGPQIKDADQVRAVVCGLLRLGKGAEMVRWYQEEAVTAIQAMIKQTQVEFVAEMNQEDVIRPEHQLEHLEISEWMTLLYRAFNNIEKLLLRIRAVYDLCLDILNSISQNQPAETGNNVENGGVETNESATPMFITTRERVNGYSASISSLNDDCRVESSDKHLSPSLARMKQLSASKSSLGSIKSVKSENTDAGSLVNEGEKSRVEGLLDEMLLESCNAAHDACAKLVAAKTEDGSLDKVNSGEFVSLCQGVESFSSKCETVCKGRRSTGLRLALQSRANRFVTTYHESHKDTLLLVLENEPFKPVKVPQNLQNMLTSAINSPDGLLKMLKCDSDNSSAVADVLSFNGEKYVVCGCVLHLIKLLLEYCQSSLDIPMVAPDLLTRMLDLLRHFNMAVYKLVLGPASTRGFSGPTISKLLMASRSLELVERLVPHLKEHFEHVLSKKQQYMMKHFPQMCRDLNEHSVQIESRVLSLVEEAIDSKLNEWVLKAPVPSNAFRGITSILIAVNNSILSTLPEERQVDILKKCHQNFIPCLRRHLLRLKVNNDGGPLHGMVIQELTFYAEILKRNGVPAISFDGVWSNLYNSNS